jgi:hypothetical protein
LVETDYDDPWNDERDFIEEILTYGSLRGSSPLGLFAASSQESTEARKRSREAHDSDPNHYYHRGHYSWFDRRRLISPLRDKFRTSMEKSIYDFHHRDDKKDGP